jgi:RNA polymerase sigma factor (sigma-70 family)
LLLRNAGGVTNKPDEFLGNCNAFFIVNSDGITTREFSLSTPPKSLPELDDRQLLELVRCGSLAESQAAMGAIYRKYELDIWRFVRSKVNSDGDADDIAMETWTHAIDRIHSFEWQSGEGNKLKAWLFKIANLKRLELFHGPNPESLDELSEVEVEARQYLANRLLGFDQENGDGDTPSLGVQREADKVLQDLLNELPPIQQQIIFLIYYRDIETAAEVGTILEIPTNTVRGYHKRALDHLKKSSMLRDYLED